MENEYEQVYTANGNLQAEMIRLFLQSFGIQAHGYQESAGATYGLTIGPLGEVKIYVHADQAEEARRILQEMEEGKYELPGLDAPGKSEADETPPSDDDFI